MNQIEPVFIELVDSYGIAPFMKWYSQVAPGLTKMHANEPLMALGAAIGLYALGQAYNMNTSGISPLETVIDFGEQSTLGQTDKIKKLGSDRPGEEAMRSLLPLIIPSLYTKPAFKINQREGDMRTEDWVRLMFPKQGNDWSQYINGQTGERLMSTDIRGFTQQILEDVFGVENANKRSFK